MSQEHCLTIARKAAAQLAEALGFDTAQESALELLSNLINRYTAHLCGSAHAYAELGGRTKMNIVDLLLVLEEQNVNLDELEKYVTEQEEVPFLHSVAAFPTTVITSGPASFASTKEEPPPHVPSFLPAFPDKHTWVSTGVFQGRGSDVKKAREAAAKRKQESEQALVHFQKRSLEGLVGDNTENNPFLAPPEVVQVAPGDAGADAATQDGDVGAQAWDAQGEGATGRSAGVAEGGRGSRLQLDAGSKALEPVVKHWQEAREAGPPSWQEVAPDAAVDDPLIPQPAVLFKADWAASMRARMGALASQKEAAGARQPDGYLAAAAASRRRKSHSFARADPDADVAQHMVEGGAEDLNADD